MGREGVLWAAWNGRCFPWMGRDAPRPAGREESRKTRRPGATRRNTTTDGGPVLKRISYISKFARPFTRDELTELADDAAKRNRPLGVTGMLMSSGDIFYQVLEGPVEAVDRLFQKIAADPRHTDVLVLSVHEAVEDRQFPSWAMKKVNLDEGAVSRMEPIKALLDALVVQREAMQRLLRVLSRSVWQELMHDDGETS